jgi:hypothetical protein
MKNIHFYSGKEFDKSNQIYNFAKNLVDSCKLLVLSFCGNEELTNSVFGDLSARVEVIKSGIELLKFEELKGQKNRKKKFK